ncbi:MAG: glutamine synthetase family protein [Hyphomicrobiales bacterium]
MTSDLQAAIAERKSDFDHIRSDYAHKGVEFVQVHFPDLTGLLRTKYAPFKVAAEGESLNAILYNIVHADGAPIGDVVFDAPICWLDNGYRSIQALVDPASAAIHGWRPNTASMMLNSFMEDGTACTLDIRARLKHFEDKARAMGFVPHFAFEYEFGIFHYDEELVQAGRYSELKPHGKSFTNYDMLRAPGYEDLIQEFMRRMESIGAPLASFVSEFGRGMYEFALKPQPALAAADAAMRAKHHVKELCQEHGLIATFMTRFQDLGGESSSGAHIHQSLADVETGAHAFQGDGEDLSETGRAYLAGLLRTMQDFHVVFRPTMNSYRHMDRIAWSPEEVYWGVENRVAAVRAINRPTAAACRLEHRCSGSDVNPYLAITAMLAAGLKGIEEGWDPGTAVPGASEEAERDRPLTRSLEASLENFRASETAKEIFGEDLWMQYIRSRENEIAAYRTWQEQHITAFEFGRYFEGT